MTTQPKDRLEIAQPLPAVRLAAIERLLADLEPLTRRRQAADLLAACERGPDCVFEARLGDRPVGVTAVRFSPGATAFVATPRIEVPGTDEPAVALLRAATDYATAKHVTMVQGLVEIGGPYGNWFAAAGFEHAADLVYLWANESEYPQSAPSGALEFLPTESHDATRLERLVEATYEGTLDCPRLNGMRSIADVLAGYRTIGKFDSRLWQIVRHESGDVGCLLLNDHADGSTSDAPLEVVYMGLIPAARGQGWGRQLVRQALWTARQAGRSRMVLAVDAANAPALAHYSALGFAPFDTRAVYLRFASDMLTTSSSPQSGA